MGTGKLWVWKSFSGRLKGRRRRSSRRITTPPAPAVTGVSRLLAAVRPCGDGAGLIGQVREVQDLKSAAAVLQAWITVAFDTEQRRSQRHAEIPSADLPKMARLAVERAIRRAKGEELTDEGLCWNLNVSLGL